MSSNSSFESGASWPANHRAALVVVIHIEAPGGHGGNPGHTTGVDYAATGLQRLLRALADLDIPATLAWTAPALATYPQLARAGQDAGHELALSEKDNGQGHDADDLLARISDIPMVGVVEDLPGWPITTGAGDDAPGFGARSLDWRITGAGGDVPATATFDGRPETVLPVSPYWIDSTWLEPDRPLPPSSLLEAWSLGLQETRTEGSLMTVVLHPHIAGRPGFAGQVIRFLDEAIESGDVWIASATQVAAWWKQSTSTEH